MIWISAGLWWKGWMDGWMDGRKQRDITIFGAGCLYAAIYLEADFGRDLGWWE